MSAGGRDGYASGDDLTDVKTDLVSSAESEENYSDTIVLPRVPRNQ